MKLPTDKPFGTKSGIDCGDGFWKSSFSTGGSCVAVAMSADGGMKVRDTKDPDKQTLTFTHDEWKVFVQGVRHGEFDIE